MATNSAAVCSRSASLVPVAARARVGGCRLAYRRGADTVYLLTVFAKGDNENLTKQELQVLKDVMKKELGNEKD
jgi:hypothetical protein